jgi:hypothetical protein
MDEHGNPGQDRHLALVAVTSSRALMPGAPAGPVGPSRTGGPCGAYGSTRSCGTGKTDGHLRPRGALGAGGA